MTKNEARYALEGIATAYHEGWSPLALTNEMTEGEIAACEDALIEVAELTDQERQDVLSHCRRAAFVLPPLVADPELVDW